MFSFSAELHKPTLFISLYLSLSPYLLFLSQEGTAPTETDRYMVRALIGADLLEVFVHAPVELCIERDVKGLYKKAIRGEISSFTGISAPFDVPLNPVLTLNTSQQSIAECKNDLLDLILQTCTRND